MASLSVASSEPTVVDEEVLGASAKAIQFIGGLTAGLCVVAEKLRDGG